MKRIGLLAWLVAAGCSGSIGGEPEKPAGNPGGASQPGGGAATPGTSGPAGPSGGPGTPGSNGGGGPAAAGACDPGSLPRARTWRLTNAQFRNTAKAVFGYVGPAALALPPDGQPDGFANQADRLSVPSLLASRYLVATDEIAANVVGRSGEFLKCGVADLGSGTCLRDFLASVGSRAWRRPLTAAELDKYVKLHATIVAANGGDGGAAWKGVVQALLLSPNFLFRTELGGGAGGASGAPVRLTDHELASAISYMIVDGPPDATLTALADAGKLADPAALAAEARRLLRAGDAAGTVGSFFRQWLHYDTLESASKDAAAFPTFTAEVSRDVMAEAQAFINGILFDPAGDGSFVTLLTAKHAYVNLRTAPLYGVTAPGAEFVKRDLPAGQRRGLLTGAAFIAGASDSDDTNLPSRGRIVREQLLCATVAPPPGNPQFEDPKITPDMTNREKLNVHTTNPACSSCHALFDGIGFAMEQYDAIGRYRTTDKTKTIDPTGTLPLGNETLKFTTFVDFVDQIARRPETYECIASQLNAFATGRSHAEIPRCELDANTKAFAEGGHELDALVTAIVTSPSFALRRN